VSRVQLIKTVASAAAFRAEQAAVAKSAQVRAIKKTDQELQIVWGEVYVPNSFPDSQKDFMSADTVRDMAYGFMAKGDMRALDTEHSREKNGCYIVESFIARKGDPDFIEGAWVLGVRVPDPASWEMVKSGDINGFSIDGDAYRKEAQLEITMPDVLSGETMERAGHQHLFYVKFDNQGNFLGGETSPGADGHFHKISRGTVTDDADDHNHRFSFVEGVMDVQIHN
jgi:hypothetical protein